MWAALRFGVLAWLGDENHPVRPVVEALSWVAGVAGFAVALVALVAARRQARDTADVGGAQGGSPTGTTAKYQVDVRDSRGVQIGDNNTQKNNLKG
ncbi:Uncharacterised protein [Amycolatopsis camponoti]|uniref:Uncharacterized protein n=1 Tax=Amycolatopsis camponoti TaxID=2606593 RepID=A0A6I8LVT9_9PSEU|nr:Uncharacterised protein [Amycolatopsis camponoti]